MSRLLQVDVYRLSQGSPEYISTPLPIIIFSGFQDFYGDEYQSHTSCMSEDQRYSKEGGGGWDPSKGQVRDLGITVTVQRHLVITGSQGREQAKRLG